MIHKKRSVNRRGAAAIEFALVMPVFLVLLLGMLECAARNGGPGGHLGRARGMPGCCVTRQHSHHRTDPRQYRAQPGRLSVGDDRSHPVRPDNRHRRRGNQLEPERPVLESKLAWDFELYKHPDRRLGHVRQRTALTVQNSRRSIRCAGDPTTLIVPIGAR